MLLTAEDFHRAAEKVGVDAIEQEHGVKEDAVYDFFDGSVFDNYPGMDGTSLAYGILIGVRAALDNIDPARVARLARALGLAQAIAECRDDAALSGIREGAAEIVTLIQPELPA